MTQIPDFHKWWIILRLKEKERIFGISFLVSEMNRVGIYQVSFRRQIVQLQSFLKIEYVFLN